MDSSPSLDRADRFGMYMSIGIVAVGAGITIADVVRRLRELAHGGPFRVLVPLRGETADLPLGPDGALVHVDVETAVVRVADPAPATMFALWAHPIWNGVFVIVGLVIATAFFLRLARGRAFTTGAARLAYAGAATLLISWFGGAMLTNMTTNGALSALSDYSYESVIFEVSLAPALVFLVLGAIGLALQIGERLQRDTEGLI